MFQEKKQFWCHWLSVFESFKTLLKKTSHIRCCSHLLVCLWVFWMAGRYSVCLPCGPSPPPSLTFLGMKLAKWPWHPPSTPKEGGERITPKTRALPSPAQLLVHYCCCPGWNGAHPAPWRALLQHTQLTVSFPSDLETQDSLNCVLQVCTS